MFARKLVAWIAVIVILMPGAYAFHTAKGTQRNATTDGSVTLVKGHTVFVSLFDDNSPPPDRFDEDFAAIGTVSKETTATSSEFERNSVLWFNDQELIPGSFFQSSSTTTTCFEGKVFVVPAGSDDPRDDDFAAYTLVSGETFQGGPGTVIRDESYTFVDPNDRSWHVHVYNQSGGGGVGDLNNVVAVVDTSAACSMDLNLSEAYNAVAMIRMAPAGHPGTFPGVVANGKQHGCDKAFLIFQGNCGANAFESLSQGNSHSNPRVVNRHTHNTVLVDLYFGLTGPTPPVVHTHAIDDSVGSAAPFDPHPCTASDNTETKTIGSSTPNVCGNGARPG